VESHRVLGGDEVETPLRLALQLECRGESRIRRALRPGRLDRIEQRDDRRAAALLR